MTVTNFQKYRFLPFWIARKPEIGISGFVSAIGHWRSLREGMAMASRHTEGSDKEEAAPGEKEKSLNFKVSPEFKKEFKGFAVSRGISMTDLLKEGFVLSKKKQQK